MLPVLRFDATRPLAAQFESATSPQAELALEIGFGGGEHLASLAEANPETNFIGAEPFLNGVASLLRHIQTRHLSNIRIWDDDVRLILPALPGSGLSQVLLIFLTHGQKNGMRLGASYNQK
jgi:Predicted S-adenosylmethionine-dependent methyltransferase